MNLWEIGFVAVVLVLTYFLGNWLAKTPLGKKLEEKKRKKQMEKLAGKSGHGQ